METEGTSTPNPEANQEIQKGNIVQFPNTKPEHLPSEKVRDLELDPDLDAGFFTMVLPKSTRGFTIQTDKNLTQTSDAFPNPLTNEEKKLVAAAMPGQMKFNRGNLAAEALKAYRQNPNQATKAAYEKARETYVEHNVSQVGIRNMRRSGDRITVDTMRVSFPVFKSLADISSRKELLHFASSGATSGSIITADNRLIIVHRNPRNDPYPDMPGASVGGYFDGTIDNKVSKESPKQGRRTLESITTKEVMGNGLKEMSEELGLEASDVSETVVAGIALEKKAVHHEFLLDLKLKLTAAQMREKSLREREMPVEEFAEKFVDIDATPEAIYTLLTQVLCPLPPTHYASFAATGYRMMLKENGQKAADEYKKKIEVGIRENMERIDGIVRKYIEANPELLTQPTKRQLERYESTFADYLKNNPNATEEDKTKHKTDYFATQPHLDSNGYNRFFLPTEQGLPDFMTAMTNAGLIKNESNAV